MAATISSNRLSRRLDHAAELAFTLRRARAPEEPDLRLLLVHELIFLEVLLAAEIESGQPEVAPLALDELCARAADRRHLTRRERHEIAEEHRLANSREVVLHTSADRPPPPGAIPCHRHYCTAFAMPKLSAVAHLGAWYFDLVTSQQILPWAVRVDPALDAPVWRPFPRPRWT